MSRRARPRATSTTGAGELLALVRSGQAATRLDLTRLSGFARSTVTDRLEQLLSAGLLLATGPAASTGGRRPSSFAFNHEAGVVLVAALGASSAQIACCDLAANVLADERHAIDIAAGPEQILPLVAERLSVVLDLAGRADDDVRGVAIGVPGPVDFAARRVVSPPIMTGWDGVDIPGMIDLPYPGPVLIEKDANLMALGEHRARLRDESTVLFVKVGTGVGSGIIVAGELHRGSEGAAGDIGHIRGPGLNEICRCGRRGCIEATVGGWALARDLQARGRETKACADVVKLLRARDPEAIELVRSVGPVLGGAIAEGVSFLNPSTVVLGGDVADAEHELLSAIQEVVYSRSLPLATRHLRIRRSELGERAGVIGGAHLVIEHVFAPDAVDRGLESKAAYRQPTPGAATAVSSS
jgi:predicted NBD/HSP70 family sugar kinase